MEHNLAPVRRHVDAARDLHVCSRLARDQEGRRRLCPRPGQACGRRYPHRVRGGRVAAAVVDEEVDFLGDAVEEGGRFDGGAVDCGVVGYHLGGSPDQRHAVGPDLLEHDRGRDNGGCRVGASATMAAYEGRVSDSGLWSFISKGMVSGQFQSLGEALEVL